MNPLRRGLVVALVLVLGVVAVGSAQSDGRLAPPEAEAAADAEAWVKNRKVGAAVLWGGLLFASVIIGAVRQRQRAARRARSQNDRP